MSVESLKSKVSQVCQEEQVRRLDLFGSRARSGGLEGNDYDLIAILEDDSPEAYAKRFFRVLHGLEDVLDAPVDLLTPDSIKRESLRRRIEEEKVCLYES
jgi:predicted nucleotidyltransferase